MFLESFVPLNRDEWCSRAWRRDTWLPVSVLKSILLPKIAKTSELPKRVDCSGVEIGMRFQAEADGVWCAQEEVSEAK